MDDLDNMSQEELWIDLQNYYDLTLLESLKEFNDSSDILQTRIRT